MFLNRNTKSSKQSFHENSSTIQQTILSPRNQSIQNVKSSIVMGIPSEKYSACWSSKKKELTQFDLKNQVLEFKQKQQTNRLKNRHKRYMTDNLQNASFLQYEEQANKTITSFTSQSNSHKSQLSQVQLQQAKFTSQKQTIMNVAVSQKNKNFAKNTFGMRIKSDQNCQAPAFNFHKIEIKQRIKLIKNKNHQEIERNCFEKKQTQENDLKQMIKTKLLKHNPKVNSELLPTSKLNMQQNASDLQFDACTFKKTKRRKNSNEQPHISSEKNKITDPQETVMLGRAQFKSIDNILNKFNPQKRPFSISQTLQHPHIAPFQIVSPFSNQITQSVQQQSSESSSSSSISCEQIGVRLGIGKINITDIQDSIHKMENFNQQLDLGMKIIDSSFQLSVSSSNIYVEANQSGERQKFCLEQSVMSPQCNQLRNKLDEILTGGSEGFQIQQFGLLELTPSIRDQSLPKLDPNICESYLKKLQRIQNDVLKSTLKKDSKTSWVGQMNRCFISSSIPLEIIHKIANLPYHGNILTTYLYEKHEKQFVFMTDPVLTSNLFPSQIKISELQTKQNEIDLSTLITKSIVKQILSALFYTPSAKLIPLNLQNIYIFYGFFDYQICIDALGCLLSQFSINFDRQTEITIHNLKKIIEIGNIFKKLRENSKVQITKQLQFESTFFNLANQLLADLLKQQNHQIQMSQLLTHPFLWSS